MSTVFVNIMGGLGNQLFQIAAAYAYARKNNGQLKIYRKRDNNNRPVYWENFLKNLESYLIDYIPQSLHEFSENKPCMYSDIGPLEHPGKLLNGYFQTSKYYYNPQIKQEIKELFRQPQELIDKIRQKYSFVYENSDRVIVIHARRTDYIQAAHIHGPLTGNYYKQALEIMLSNIKNPIFVLTSDDNKFWNEIKSDIDPIFDYQYLILEDESEINTLVLLQQFQNFIMSNSTFIWWAVWLSNYKNVIVPSKWFGYAGPSPWSDIYEDDWIQL